MCRLFCRVAAAAATVASSGVCGSAPGAVIPFGTHVLGNHPAFIGGPGGMQLDELYNVTPQADRFLFDFDHSDSLMLMDVSATMIRVYGTVYGGRWTVGSGFISDAYLGLYTVDMLYNVGVMPVPGDDDMWVNGPNNANHGLIGTPVGDVIDLWDERGSFNFSFRLGDEDHDRGHRGFSGISGWGWLNHGPDPTIHHDVGDLLFVSHGLIPAPGMGALVLLGLGFAARRRR